MKIKVNVFGKVKYESWLNEEDSLKVAKYMEDNDVFVEEAIEDLYHEGIINPYEYCREIDFTTLGFYDGEVEYDEEDE